MRVSATDFRAQPRPECPKKREEPGVRVAKPSIYRQTCDAVRFERIAIENIARACGFLEITVTAQCPISATIIGGGSVAVTCAAAMTVRIQIDFVINVALHEVCD